MCGFSASPLEAQNLKRDLARALAFAIGSGAALAVLGWPSALGGVLATIGGGVVGLLVCFGVEYILRLRGEVARLQTIEADLASEKNLREKERVLFKYDAMIARREAAVAEIGVKVWGEAFNGVNKRSGSPMPVSVLIARQQNMLQAKNLDKPPPPPPS